MERQASRRRKNAHHRRVEWPVWQLDAKEYAKDKPLHITEGIINALSFFAMGQQAVALAAAATDPAKFDFAKLATLGSKIILAFDGDKAGADYSIAVFN